MQPHWLPARGGARNLRAVPDIGQRLCEDPSKSTDRDRLEWKLIVRETGNSNQVVVAIFQDLEGESLEDYPIRLAPAWPVGQKGLDNGVIFLIFVDDRKMRIEVGYGLEGNVTDAVASSILRAVVAPRFREGRIADGIGAGLDAIDRAIAGTYRRPPRSRSNFGQTVAVLLAFGLVALGPVGTLILLVRNRKRGWTGSSAGWGRPTSGGADVSNSGGSSGGGSSSDGFSGGGGSFGGGGASDSW